MELTYLCRHNELVANNKEGFGGGSLVAARDIPFEEGSRSFLNVGHHDKDGPQDFPKEMRGPEPVNPIDVLVG